MPTDRPKHKKIEKYDCVMGHVIRLTNENNLKSIM